MPGTARTAHHTLERLRVSGLRDWREYSARPVESTRVSATESGHRLLRAERGAGSSGRAWQQGTERGGSPGFGSTLLLQETSLRGFDNFTDRLDDERRVFQMQVVAGVLGKHQFSFPGEPGEIGLQLPPFPLQRLRGDAHP